MSNDSSNLLAGIFLAGFAWVGVGYVDTVLLGFSEGTLNWAFAFVYIVIVYATGMLGGFLLGSGVMGLVIQFKERSKTYKDRKVKA